jgi:hypothetical protein
MNSWKVILATVVIFGAGVLTGGLLVNYVDLAHGPTVRFPFLSQNPRRQMGELEPHPGELPRPRPPEIWRKEFIGHLDKRLNLTPEQHQAISKIIAEGQEQNREIWRTNAAPKMRQVMEQVLQRIRAKLTPEQRKQFEAMTRQFAPRHLDERPPVPPATNNIPPPDAPPDV